MAATGASFMDKLKQIEFSQVAFVHGLIGVFVFYGVLILVMSFQSEGVTRAMEEELASASVAIERTTIEDLKPDPVQESFGQPFFYKELIERTAPGPLPMVDKISGLTPFDAYKRPGAKDSSRPRIAVVIDDFGLSDIQSDKMLKVLPENITYMLDPYSPNAQKWTDMARRAGGELWMKVPFQTAAYPSDDGGPHAIIAKSSLRKNRNHMLWIMSRASGYAGLIGYTDYFRNETSPTLRGTAEMAFNRGLGFVEIAQFGNNEIIALSNSQNRPYAKSDFKFDIITQNDLKKIEEFARDIDEVIIAVKPFPKNIQILRSWLAGFDDKGLQLVPASYLAQQHHSLAAPNITAEDLEVKIIEGVDMESLESPSDRAVGQPVFPEIKDGQ